MYAPMISRLHVFLTTIFLAGLAIAAYAQLAPDSLKKIAPDASTSLVPGVNIPFVDPWPPDLSRIYPQPLAGNTEPAFPDSAVMAGVTQGKVIVQVLVDKHGDVKKWQFARVDPPSLGFQEEVDKVIPLWKFSPAIQNGQPVGSLVAIPFKFKPKH
jgi:TonB family protein